MCILGLSQVLIYEFHYNYIRNKYDNKTRLLFTDANSIMHEIKTEDVYEDFKRDEKCLFWGIIMLNQNIVINEWH